MYALFIPPIENKQNENNDEQIDENYKICPIKLDVNLNFDAYITCCNTTT